MDVLHGEGVRAILWLQKTLGSHADILLFLSRVGDPGSILLYFPITLYANKALGVMVLWVAVMAEWTNLVLKWFLRGERPYWWIHETELYKNLPLTQYPLTCETGPGSPSGHAMVSTAVFFTILSSIVIQIKENLHSYPILCRLVCCTLWLCFLTIISLVSLSRVFIATHFPHQVIGGALGGIAISYAAQKYTNTFMKITLKSCMIISFMLLVSTLIIYTILSHAVFDPSESVQKAQKWCANPAYIHIETRPFFALVRDAGAALGIGLGLWLCKTNGFDNSKAKGFLEIGAEILLSLLLIFPLKAFKVSFTSDLMSYVFGYFKSALVVVLVLFFVPVIVNFFGGIFKRIKNKTV